MIEKIQFGGITRRPSDLSAKEGTCEESLNVVLDVNEVAPVIEPEDKTAALVGNTTAVSTNATDKYIYIHKTGSYENYIVIDGANYTLHAYVNGVRSSALMNFVTLSETYKDITSIGNTLIVSTSRNIHYLLYKSELPNKYLYLGTRIPEPLVEFRAVPAASGEGVKSYRKLYDIGATLGDVLTGGTLAATFFAAAHNPDYTMKQFWDELAAHYGEEKSANDDIGATEGIDAVSDFIWDQYQIMNQQNRNQSLFSSAVLVRSALKLYDESYIYQSVPYLLHRGGCASMVVSAEKTASSGGITITLSNVYKAKVTITYPDLANWSDIVRSVDIFVSTDICNPKVNSRVDGAVEWTVTSGGTTLTYTYLKFLGQSDWNDIKDVKEEILSKVNFYLAESRQVSDIGAGATFYLEPTNQDKLLVKETLPDDNLSHHTAKPENGIMSYNSRLIFRGLTTELYRGYPFLQGMVFCDAELRQLWMDPVFENDYMLFRFYIRTESGEQMTVIARNSVGAQLFTYPTETVDSTTRYGFPCGFLYYPDPRCYRCDIYYGGALAPTVCYTIPMQEHPGLNGAYAICDLAKPVSSLDSSPDSTVTTYPTEENRTYTETNKLLMSEAMNPFLFLLTNRQTFLDDIISVATTTKALSTGQFGQFPLYVFTKGGVWAVPVTDTGAMSTAVPVSRDVVLSEEAVTPIDQAIVLVTEKGVMILSGSDLSDISPEMDGRHYAIETAALSLLTDTEWYRYASILSDTTPFMTFMKDAHAVYDYAGRKLIFFNDKSALLRSYQYVYKMDTGTWHKMSMVQTGINYIGILNGYPESLVCMRNSSNIYRIYNLSVRYNPSATQNTLSQVMITRPLDLGQPYIRKTVNRLLVRGILNHSHVKYLILGSPDGQNYHVIHSLRGPSNNIFFRIMVFGILTPTERISFLEIDHEPRFTDKPR